MNILPKKSWHVRNKDNIARVRRDEAQAAEEEREVQRRVERAEQEARTAYLRRKSQAGRCGQELEAGEEEHPAIEEKHLNLFPVEEAGEKRGNEEYLKEKRDEKERQERAIGLLVSLGPAPGTEATPWYLKDRASKEEKEDERDKAKAKKEKGRTEEEKEKKDRRLKDTLDPMREMKKALAIKDKHKSKKKERRERGQKRSAESSIERLRAERLEREAAERKRAQALLDQGSGSGKEKDQQREMEERDRPYNSAYFPQLARKRQRRERDQYGL
ncbi:hypothetical protein SKAU_G00224550 [Synaphobranchus kaupii]|uniref:CBF1-interacting co-repressor CIR N-terminal domain-containing protein n=1 Tax=Synaphobranchus kaupii TaxID=118154 RepID=A0A9Q1IWD8_SYNKA|nr:hypothetical protein SKAU_G00224550 [Synaphobranchus kaupii]